LEDRPGQPAHDQAQLAKDKIVHDTLQIILGEDDLAA
jgi:hypothetical protein